MIVTEIFYGIKCNRCKNLFDDGEHSYWSDEGSAEEYATESDWIEDKGKHYCPNCYEDNEEQDDYVIKPPYPNHLNQLKDFLKTTIGHTPSIKEMENSFDVSVRSYRRTELHPYEESYIQCLMGVNFNSLEIVPSKYSGIEIKVNISK